MLVTTLISSINAWGAWVLFVVKVRFSCFVYKYQYQYRYQYRGRVLPSHLLAVGSSTVKKKTQNGGGGGGGTSVKREVKREVGSNVKVRGGAGVQGAGVGARATSRCSDLAEAGATRDLKFLHLTRRVRGVMRASQRSLPACLGYLTL